MDLTQLKFEYIPFEHLISAVEKLLTIKYHELEEHHDDLNILDIVSLASASLVRDAVKSIDSHDNRIHYKIEETVVVKIKTNIVLWEDMLNALLKNVSNEYISKDSQQQCYKAVVDNMTYSVNNSQLFSVILRHFRQILENLDTKLFLIKEDITSRKEVAELMRDLRGKLENNKTVISMEQVLLDWENHRDARMLVEALEGRNLAEERLEELVKICYKSWRDEFSGDATSRESEELLEPLNKQVYKLVASLKYSNNIKESVEEIFRIVLKNGNPEINRKYTVSEFSHQLIDTASELMGEMLGRVERKSGIPSRILNFVLTALSVNSKQSTRQDIIQFLQQIPAGVVKIVRISNIHINQLEEIINLLLLSGMRCLERDIPICPYVSTLYQTIDTTSLGTLDYSIARDSLKFAVTYQRLPLSSRIEEIFETINQFTASFHHPSLKSKRKSIRSLLRFSRAMIIVGDNPIEILGSFLRLVMHDEVSSSQNITYGVKCLMEAIGTKLAENCVTVRDILNIIIPAISQIMNGQEGISNTNKIRLTIDCSTSLIKTVHSIHDFRILLDYALPLIEFILTQGGGVREINRFFRSISVRFFVSRAAYLLQFAQTAAGRLAIHYPKESRQIKAAFYYLLMEGPLTKISHIYQACQEYVFEEKLIAPLHIIFYNVAYTTEILRLFADIVTALCFIHRNEFGNPTQNNSSERFRNLGTENLAKKVAEKIHSEDMSQNMWEDLYVKAMLSAFYFMAIKEEDVIDECNIDEQDLFRILNDCINPLVRNSIVSITQRIIYMEMRIYSPLKSKVVQLLLRALYQNYNINNSPRKLTRLLKTKDDVEIVQIQENIQHYISQDKFNKKTVESLVVSGYSRDIFRRNIQLQVRVPSRREAVAERELKDTLAQCKEYQHLLKYLSIRALWFSHSKVLVDDLFRGQLTPQQTEARLRYAKMHLLKWINKRYIPAYHLKTVQLLENERNSLCESTTNSTKLNKHRNGLLTVTLLTQFNQTILSCSDTVRQFGAHNEIPLEVAIRQDRALVSIRTSHNNKEVETCQLIFMEEGVYVMESTTNCTDVDTTSAWCQLFTKLLTTDRLVPSIILPRGHPNTEAWSCLNEMVQTESSSSHLTWSPFYSYEWITYYTNVPSKVQAFNDIVMHPGFSNSKGKCQSMVPVWCAQTDIVGIVLQQVLTHLSKTKLSRVYSNYTEDIRLFLSEHLLLNSKKKVSFELPVILEEEVMKAVDSWILSINLNKLFISKRKIFFELKHFVFEMSNQKNKYKHVRAEIKNLLSGYFHIFIISDLPYEVQLASMIWMEQIEESSWNAIQRVDEPYRDLVKLPKTGAKPFHGLVCFFLPEYKQKQSVPLTIDVLTPDKVCGYLLGVVTQFCEANPNRASEDIFNMCGTWIDPDFRKLGLSADLYISLWRNAPVRYFGFDWGYNPNSHFGFIFKISNFLNWFGLMDMIINRIVKKKETGSSMNFIIAGANRDFKSYIIDFKPLWPFLKIDTFLQLSTEKLSRFRLKSRRLTGYRFIWIIVGLISIFFAMLLKYFC